MNIDDVAIKDKQGILRLVPSKTAKWLQKEKKFITIEGTDNLYCYDDKLGYWKRSGEIEIKKILETELSDLISNHTVKEIIEHIRRNNYCNPSVFNSRPGYINLQNGIYDIEEHALIEHDDELYFSYVLPFNYTKDAVPKKFLEFVIDICQGDMEQAISVIEGFAYTFVPGYPIQKANMLVGNGANGKGTLLNVLKSFVGEDNCEHLTIQTICKETSFSLARLYGKLLNIGPDLPSEGLSDAGNFKAVTGGDSVGADVKYAQEALKFRNNAKLWFSANKIPESPEDTIAYYRRWNIWKFTKQFEEGRDILPELVTEEELSGIFNLVMEVYPYLSHRLKYSFSRDIEGARKEYLRSADTIQLFIDERLEYDPEADIPKSEIYQAYLEFCKVYNLIVAGKEPAFWRVLKRKVTYQEHTPSRGGPRWISGQRLNVPEEQKEVTNRPDSKTILEKYYNELQLQQVQQVFPLLFEYLEKYKYITIGQNGVAPAADDADNNSNNMEKGQSKMDDYGEPTYPQAQSD